MITAGVGPYDRLYEAAPEHVLWESEPGRDVASVAPGYSARDAVDLGCGDGANSLFLESLGFRVTGVDCSRLALSGLENRFRGCGLAPQGEYLLADVLQLVKPVPTSLLVSSGLYHCLPNEARLSKHRAMQSAVSKNGLVIFCSLVDLVSDPPDHGTPPFDLPCIREVEELFEGWEIVGSRLRVIVDRHPPAGNKHLHSLVWVVARNPSGWSSTPSSLLQTPEVKEALAGGLWRVEPSGSVAQELRAGLSTAGQDDYSF